jgi:serine phosphatase RsbU (regulator of sigma subunit)
MNEDDDLYGEGRLLAALNSVQELTPGKLLPHMKADIDKFAGGAPQSDDVTMLALLINQIGGIYNETI